MRPGQGRLFTTATGDPSGEHYRRLKMTRVEQLCPYTQEVEKSKRRDLLELLTEEKDKAKMLADFVKETQWKTSIDVLSTEIAMLGLEPSIADINYKQSVQDIQKIVANNFVVANVAQHYIGRYMKKLMSISGNSESKIVLELCNASMELQRTHYRRLRDACGCTECTDAQEWEEEGSQGREGRPTPCIRTQIKVKLESVKYLNMTPSFFQQCRQFADIVPFLSPLTFFPEPPSDLRHLAVKYAGPLKEEINKQDAALSSGLHPVFIVNSTLDAIHYTDGDGGYLRRDLIPGLKEHLEQIGAEDLRVVEGINGFLIPFREANHDAIELGHTYTITDVSQSPESRHTKEYGYMALVEARKNLAESSQTLVVPLDKDMRGRRLLVEIFTKNIRDEKPHGEENGIRLIKAGLSFPTDGAPAHCTAALEEAKLAKAGIWEFGDVMDDPALKPWELKRTLQRPGEFSSFEYEDLELVVLNEAKHLNEARVLIGKSTIPGADRGLFIRPGAAIPSGKTVCSYQKEPDDEEDRSQTSDYLLEAQVKGKIYLYQAATYDGQNIGRFINQGGLEEGLREMCLLSDKDAGQSSFHQRDVDGVFNRHCNVVYTTRGRELVVKTSKEIPESRDKATELFSNYKLPYWIKFVVRHHEDLGHESFLARSVLWCLLSDHSCWSESERRPHTGTFSDELKKKFKTMPCPYTRPSRRRT